MSLFGTRALQKNLRGKGSGFDSRHRAPVQRTLIDMDDDEEEDEHEEDHNDDEDDEDEDEDEDENEDEDEFEDDRG